MFRAFYFACVVLITTIVHAGSAYAGGPCGYSSSYNSGYSNSYYNQNQYAQPFVLIPVDPYIVSNRGNLYQSVGQLVQPTFSYQGGYSNYGEAARGFVPGGVTTNQPAALQNQQALQAQQRQVQQTQPPAANNYLTKDEFIATMRELYGKKNQTALPADPDAEQEEAANQPAPDEMATLKQQVGGVIKASCAACHTGSSSKGKWKDGNAHNGQPVVLLKNGLLVDDINWDRVSLVTTTKKMPEGDTKLSQQATVLLARYALKVAGQQTSDAAKGGDPKTVPPAPADSY